MKKALPFILTGAAVLLFYFYSKGAAAKNLKVYFKDIYTKKIKGQLFPAIYARFTINNGANTPLTVNSIVGDITVNGNAFSSVSSFDKYTIAANSSSVLTLKIETPVTSVAQLVYNLLTRKEKINVRFEGTVNSTGVVMPISQSIVMF